LSGKPTLRAQLKDLFLLAIPLAGAVFAAAIVLSGRATGLSTGIGTESANLLTALLACAVLLCLMLYGLKYHPNQLTRIVVACITIAGTVSGLILLKLLFAALGVFPVLFLLALPAGYLGVRWSFLSFWGSLSKRKTSLLLIASSTLLGSLIGTSLPSTFTVAFLAGLAVLDFLAVETNLLTRMIGSLKYDEVTSLATLPLETSLVGIGDFLAYSMLVAMSLQLIGFLGAIETIGLILAGALVTLQITRLRSRAAGLLIPVGLGLIPVILAL